MTHYWTVTTSAVIVPGWAQTYGGGLPTGDYATGYTRTKREAERIAKLDRRQGGRPVIERVEVTR